MTQAQTTHPARRTHRLVTAFAAVGLCVPAALVAALLSVGACLGSEGAGVAAGSPRGQVCDVPALGPWLPVLAVAVLATGWAVRALLISAHGRVPREVVVLVPAASVLLVPGVLHLVPR